MIKAFSVYADYCALRDKSSRVTSFINRKIMVDSRFCQDEHHLLLFAGIESGCIDNGYSRCGYSLMRLPISSYLLEMIKNCTDWRALFTTWSSTKLQT